MPIADIATSRRDAALSDVASILWRERDLLADVLYALSCQQLVLASGNVRWLASADAQVSAAVDTLTDGELRRAMATDELARALGLPGDAALDEIIDHLDEPWDLLLADHRDTLRTLVAEIGVVTAENRRMLQAGAEAVDESLARLSENRFAPVSPLYPGAETSSVTGSVLFDGQA